VGQVFVAIGLLARRQAEQLDEDSVVTERVRRLAELADGGKWELEQAIRALAFVPAERRGLAPALRALAESFERDSGISVLVETVGKPVRLAPALERALYRIANEALTNAWRHARCSFVRLELCFEGQEVALHVVDDGVGLSPRLRDRGPGLGIMSMRRAIAEVDGVLHVRNAQRHGVKVEARVRLA
jgi:signal transduction histidine kinase